jgi:hypothetical protein
MVCESEDLLMPSIIVKIVCSFAYFLFFFLPRAIFKHSFWIDSYDFCEDPFKV